jgi:hypothetical protein
VDNDRDWGWWDWVQFVPKSTWPTPDDIMEPTRIPDLNLLVRVLVSDLVGNLLVEVVGELIAERARFNMWYATHVDGQVPPETQAALYTLYRDTTQRMYEPWAQYKRACEAVRGGSMAAMSDSEVEHHAEAEHDALLTAWRTVVRDLADARRSLDTNE